MRTGFDPGPVHVGLVDKVATKQAFPGMWVFFPDSICLSKLHTHHLNINNIRRTNGTLKSNALSEIVERWIEKYIHFNLKYRDRMFFRNVANTHFYIKSNPRNKFSSQSK